MNTHNLCFEQKYEKYHNFYLKNFHFLVVKFSVYLNRRVFVMIPRMHKVSYWHLLSINTFYSVQLFCLADRESSDQTVQKHRLIWAFTVCICLRNTLLYEATHIVLQLECPAKNLI